MSPRNGDPAMQCQECMALLTDHLEGTLTPQKQQALEDHLRVCPDCGPHNANFLKTIELARAAGRPTPQPGPSPSARALIDAILSARKNPRK